MTEERNPVDQLVELFVYAPIGLLYERDDVLPRLVTRGRSQVQLARLLGQLALQRGQGQLEDRLVEVLGPPGSALARLVTEVGAAIGLAPPTGTDGATQPGATAPDGAAGSDAPTAADAGDGAAQVPTAEPVDVPSTPSDEPTVAAPLPIAGYDQLPARAIIPLLLDLSPSQREVVRRYEQANRGRKTVLNQLDRLGG